MKATTYKSATLSLVPKSRSSQPAAKPATTMLISSNQNSPDTKPLSWEPDPYMLAVAKWLVQHQHGAILLDPGMRKTSITLAAFCALLKRGFAKRAIVIAPRRVCWRVWPKEVAKWIDFNHLRVAVYHGPRKERAAKEDAHLYVMTHDGFKSFVKAGHLARLKPDTLIIDELSKYKRGTSARHKFIRPYLARFKRRWGLTGSFTPKSYLDAWGQIYIMDRGKALGPYFSEFQKDMFLPTGYEGYVWVPKHNTKKTLIARLKDVAISLEASDYIKLPELVMDDRVFDLPDNVRVQYDEMENELLTFVAEGRIMAPNAAVAKNKCRQICSGALYGPGLEARREIFFLHEEKMDLMEELVEELQGAPLFVIYEFQFEIEMVQKRFKNVPVLGGGTTDKQADEMIERWNKNQESIILVHPQSGGHGLNMQEGNAAHILGLTLPWDYEYYDQVIRRIRRSGNKAERIFLHRALAFDSVEYDVIKSLSSKEKVQWDFVSALKFRAVKKGLYKE